jgi:hypothetical protein
MLSADGHACLPVKSAYADDGGCGIATRSISSGYGYRERRSGTLLAVFLLLVLVTATRRS